MTRESLDRQRGEKCVADCTKCHTVSNGPTRVCAFGAIWFIHCIRHGGSYYASVASWGKMRYHWNSPEMVPQTDLRLSLLAQKLQNNVNCPAEYPRARSSAPYCLPSTCSHSMTSCMHMILTSIHILVLGLYPNSAAGTGTSEQMENCIILVIYKFGCMQIG